MITFVQPDFTPMQLVTTSVLDLTALLPVLALSSMAGYDPLKVMIGVTTDGFYFGHSMPPTLYIFPKIEYTHKNVIKKYIYQKIYKNMNNLYFIIIYHIKL
jgi:hypothetical protein